MTAVTSTHAAPAPATPASVTPDLQAALDDPHQQAAVTLDGRGAKSLAAVTWTSVHLAAVGRVLYPAVLRHVPAADARVDAQRGVDRRLQHALWLLDRRITGAQAQSQTPVQPLLTDVRDALADHAAGEHALLAELTDVTDGAQQGALTGQLAAVSAAAPTRPHPDTAHVKALGRVTFTVEAWTDRIRDRLDNRSIPTPRRRRPIPAVGKWGSTLTAAPRRPQATPPAEDNPEPPAG